MLRIAAARGALSRGALKEAHRRPLIAQAAAAVGGGLLRLVVEDAPALYCQSETAAPGGKQKLVHVIADTAPHPPVSSASSVAVAAVSSSSAATLLLGCCAAVSFAATSSCEKAAAAGEEGSSPTTTGGDNCCESKKVESQSPGGNNNTAQWRVYTDIGRDLARHGRHEEAGKYLRRALKEARAGFGEADPHVAAARNNLAELYRIQGRWAEAEALYTEALQALEKAYGSQHASVGTALHNLAGCHLAKGDHETAYRTYRTALERKEASLGMNHPEYAATLFHMAEALRAGGRRKDAAVLLEQSVRILDSLGAGHTSAALRRQERLAQLLGEAGDHAGAEALLEGLPLSGGICSTGASSGHYGMVYHYSL